MINIISNIDKQNWIITSTDFPINTSYSKVFTARNFIFFAEKSYELPKQQIENDNLFFIDGYILPRSDAASAFSNEKSPQLLEKLFQIYGSDFIHQIKGIFALLILDKNKFSLYSDQLGLKKFFYHASGNSFIISNDLRDITKNVDSSVDNDVIAIHSLMNHYIDGYTLFRNVHYNKPASVISYDGSFKIDSYWHPGILLESTKNKLSYSEFTESFSSLTTDYIGLPSQKVIITLTGGFDSRTILASLLNIETHPDIYGISYGDPASRDVQIARQIATKVNIKLVQYNPNRSLTEWFDELSDEIVANGNSLCHLHRAHRLAAIKYLKEQVPDLKMLFGGYLGGESIRGNYYDDLILTGFVNAWWNTDVNRETLISQTLSDKCIRPESVDLERILDILNSLPFFSDDSIKNQFYFLYMVQAQMHHAQDLNFFSNYIPLTVPIFMDIDYLELVYSSGFDFISNFKLLGQKLSRMKTHEIFCRMLNQLSPELSNIPVAKKGAFTPREFLGNKKLLLVRRGIRKLFEPDYPPNFSLGKWMTEFVETQLINHKNDEINDIIDLKLLRSDFFSENHQTVEKYWHKYTYPILVKKCARYYL